ncbi:MAG: hypothetical protein Q8L66_14705 [Caulobacter sp.]|nr:hypothetical protein [Caulobacter sp.]
MIFDRDITRSPELAPARRRAAGEWRYAASLIVVALIIGGALLFVSRDHAEPGKTVAAASMTQPPVLDR